MSIDFKKGNGLIPVIVQHQETLQVLMLGYMNEEAYDKTIKSGLVTFYSRSKQRLWTKGETSGNTLDVQEISVDCDKDTLLVKARPNGPTCHTGQVSCFGEQDSKGFLYTIEDTIRDRIDNKRTESYTYTLFQRGMNKVAQKVGEEAVELVIEAKDNQIDLFKNEAADLLYHYLVLLKAKGVALEDIEDVLRARSISK